MRCTRTALGCSCSISGAAIAAFCSRAFLAARSDVACALVLLAGGATCASYGCSSFGKCTILRLKCFNPIDESLYAPESHTSYISHTDVRLVVGCLTLFRIGTILSEPKLLMEILSKNPNAANTGLLFVLPLAYIEHLNLVQHIIIR